MTKKEALDSMFNGKKVRHMYYSDKEYLFINNNRVFETENGYTHGTINDDFWMNIQKWETGWEIYKN